MESKLTNSELTEKIIKVFYDVYNILGYVFFRKSISKFDVFRIEKQRI
jgi:hypothetical protein